MRHRNPSYTKAVYKYITYKPLRPGADDYKNIKSVSSSPQSNETSLRVHQQYSGTELLGIATMHKSNSVPITRSSDMAIATAKMRRG